VEAQEKLKELVDGRGAVNATGKRIRWKTVSSAAADLSRNRRSDLLFGPKVSDELRANFALSMPDADVLQRPVLRAFPANQTV
jgi:hypothetical protein